MADEAEAPSEVADDESADGVDGLGEGDCSSVSEGAGLVASSVGVGVELTSSVDVGDGDSALDVGEGVVDRSVGDDVGCSSGDGVPVAVAVGDGVPLRWRWVTGCLLRSPSVTGCRMLSPSLRVSATRSVLRRGCR